MKPADNAPCVDCSEVHRYDEQRGYRHPDGHAYRPTPVEATSPTKPDDYSVLFGEFAACRRCAAYVAHTRDGHATHDAWHAQLDELGRK